MEILIGIFLSFIVAFPAYKKQSLTVSGFFAALILGSIIYYTSSFIGFSSMILFFISSSIISKINKQSNVENNIVEKGSCRDYSQVLANGSVALVFSIIFKITNNTIFLSGVIIAFACANADTWASEIGSRSKDTPVYILRRIPVAIGLSGGVTKLGFGASILGSSVISFWYFILLTITNGFELKSVYIFLLISGAGFLGSIIDSILGEFFQVKYISWKDKTRITEIGYEECKENTILSGIKWFDNNLVNFVSGLMSSLIVVAILLIY